MASARKDSSPSGGAADITALRAFAELPAEARGRFLDHATGPRSADASRYLIPLQRAYGNRYVQRVVSEARSSRELQPPQESPKTDHADGSTAANVSGPIRRIEQPPKVSNKNNAEGQSSKEGKSESKAGTPGRRSTAPVSKSPPSKAALPKAGPPKGSPRATAKSQKPVRTEPATPADSHGPAPGARGARSWGQSEIVLPMARSSGARDVTETIARSGKAMRQELADRVGAGTDGVHREISQQRSRVVQTGVHATDQITGAFSAAHQEVDQTVSGARAQVATEAEAGIAALGEWLTSATNRATEIFATGSTRVLGTGDTYGDKVVHAAEDEANKAAGQFKARIAEAKRIGEEKARAGGSKPEIVEAKAKAARDLAADTEDKVQSAVDDFLPDIRANGPDVASSYRAEAANAATQLMAGLPGVLTQIATAHEKSGDAISQGASQASQALSSTAEAVSASLVESEQKALGQLHDQVSQYGQQLNAAGEQAGAALDSAGHSAAKAGDQQLSRLNQQVSGLNLGSKQASTASGSIVSAIETSYRGVFQQADEAATAIQTQAGQSAGAGVRGIVSAGPAVSKQLGDLVAKTRDSVGTQTKSMSTQLAGAVTQTRTAGDGMLQDLSTGLDTQLGTLDQAFGKGLEDYRKGLQDQVSKGLDDVREPTDTLPDRIAKAQQKIEDQADKSWLERQWDDFVSIISDPGFWAAVLVGLVLVALAIFLLPEELGILAVLAIGVAIGAISAGVGTIVSNLWHGKPWDENLLRNMAIGAGAGAVFALATVGLAALGFGVGSLGFIAGMSLTAGVVTVVTNLINGRRWDEGLLANMAFAGLFAWAAKFFPKPGGTTPVEPDPVPPKPTDPVPPKPTDPVPPKPTDPVPPEPKPPEPYNPTARTDAELVSDTDPTPRPGESAEAARQRVIEAEHEVAQRKFHSLGDTPREADLGADDARFRTQGAHTIDHHGSDIPLRMPRDAAGNRNGVPTGTKSIEGRIFGDTGWEGQANSSFKWISDQIMNDTVNGYIKANWEQIRLDLAVDGRHAANFTAPPGAVGEGFFNPNQALPGPLPRTANFMQTNLVRIVIQLSPGPPPEFFVVTSFPNALGAPAH